MRVWRHGVYAAGVLIVGLPQAAAAQQSRSWVSGVGDDANPCSRTAPCKTFAGALAKTVAGGEIDVLDAGSFGTVTITKSVTIRAQGVSAGVLVTSGAAITVNAGAGDQVVLDGLTLEGLGSGSAGVSVIQAGDVLVTRTTISKFTQGVAMGGATQVRVTLEESKLVGNVVGLALNTSGGQGHAKAFFNLFLSNLSAGVQVIGAGNDVLLSGNQVLGSAKALDLQSGGAARSFGDNVITNGDSAVLVAKS